jgi:hypothetical protein
MRRIAVVGLGFGLSLGLTACGGGGASGDDDSTTPDALPAGWETLIEGSWDIPQGEQYQCVRKTVDHDIWIQAFDANIPLGHHHAVLTVDTNPSTPDGTTQCDAGSNAPAMIYGNAPGVDPIQFPPGVAVKVPAGSQLDLNLHLFNTDPSGNNIQGTSSVLIQTIDPGDVQNEAEIVLMGPVTFSVPSGDSDVNGHCTMTGDTNLFLFSPHMHKLGVHQLVVAHRAAGDMTLHDEDYSFNDQKFYDLGLVPMQQGDTVDVTCSYHNDGAPTEFGQSTTQEMCFASTYRYPKLGGAFGIICPN